jgi:hypothetical protein
VMPASPPPITQTSTSRSWASGANVGAAARTLLKRGEAREAESGTVVIAEVKMSQRQSAINAERNNCY